MNLKTYQVYDGQDYLGTVSHCFDIRDAWQSALGNHFLPVQGLQLEALRLTLVWHYSPCAVTRTIRETEALVNRGYDVTEGGEVYDTMTVSIKELR